MKKIFTFLACTTLAAGVLAFGCKGGGSNGTSDIGSTESGDCTGGGYCGDQTITVTADIGGADAMFVAAQSSSVVSDVSAGKAITVSSESPLYKMTDSGIIGVLHAAYASSEDALSALPQLSFVAVSPIGHVILVFEYPFVYRDEADGVSIEDYSDPWSPSSPFSCQIFIVNKKINTVASGDDPEGLTCLTDSLQMNTWDSRAAMIQFDGDGGVYFAAHVPDNWKNVLLKWTPGTDNSSTSVDESATGGSLSEVINANICFREFMVTNEGGVLYSGVTSTDGQCSGTSFLRYKTPSGNLQEITSGWWEYVFKPIESTDFTNANLAVMPDITTANTGQILFYGPNPEIATSPEWDDACLFKFNPDASGEARSIQIADCDIDVWQYLNDASTLATEKSRCTETKSMLGGGNIPEKILLADLNSDGDNYEIYVVGNTYEKKAGEWLYDMCVNAPHCVNSNSVPTYTYQAQGTCEAVTGNTWKTNGDCYNQSTDSTLYTALNTGGAAANDTNWQLNGQWCQQPGNDWRDTYSALTWVIWDGDNGTPTDDTDDTRQIVRLSDNDEIVRNGWNISNNLVYSSYVASDDDLSDGDDSGQYKLRKIVWADADADEGVDHAAADLTDGVPNEISKADLLTGIEVYELFADPRTGYEGNWFFNGLNFEPMTDSAGTQISGNQYITGTFDPDDPDGTLRVESSITGQIETLVIVPSF